MPAYFAAFADEIKRQFTDINQRFNAIDKRFDAIDNRFDTTESRFDAIDDKLDLIAMTVKRHDEVLDEHSILLRAMAGRHDNHEERITSLERSVTRLRLKIDS